MERKHQMNVLKTLAISSIALILVACGSSEKQITVQRVEVEKPRLDKPFPIRPDTFDVDFKLITKKTQELLLLESRLFYGLNEPNFEVHIDNMQNILRYVRQLEITLQAYMNYYEKDQAEEE